MKCGSVTCEKPARWEVAWPAQSLRACDDCSLRAVRIANAMGFSLACVPLDQVLLGELAAEEYRQAARAEDREALSLEGGIPRGPELNEETKEMGE
jgi:hypothetical protein